MTIDSCRLCPRSCAVVRTAEEGRGWCACAAEAKIARAALHMWEEPCISGTRGSGAVFFSGCTLRCKFCQNYEISAQGLGRKVSAQELSEIFVSLEQQGAHNINLVTGTQFIPVIISALELHRPRIPIVWNTSGYETSAAIDTLAPYVDIWLPDIKYALSHIAQKYSGAPDYPDVAFAAVRKMQSLQPELVLNEQGIAERGVIVRHLVLPSNTRNSLAVLERIKRELLPNTTVSIMAQYTPHGALEECPELKRRITEREYDKVLDAALELEIDGFAQDLSAADDDYIPDFCGE